MRFFTEMIILFCLILTAAPVFGGDGIKDNSFLVEEAYNQESGVVQFINGYQYSDQSHDWNYSFTNKIPVGDETHQISYTLPVSKRSGDPDMAGVGDLLLNYRHQLVNNEFLAMAPRLSLILPTADSKKGLGTGAVGYQFNQSVSLEINDKWSNHWNAGFTFTPSAKNTNSESADIFGFNFGTSVIYEWTNKTNFLCEFVMNNGETVIGPDSKIDSTTYLFLPGVRTAFDGGDDTEIVPGIGAILGLGPSAVAHERGLFGYLSIESKLW